MINEAYTQKATSGNVIIRQSRHPEPITLNLTTLRYWEHPIRDDRVFQRGLGGRTGLNRTELGIMATLDFTLFNPAYGPKKRGK